MCDAMAVAMQAAQSAPVHSTMLRGPQDQQRSALQVLPVLSGNDVDRDNLFQ
jgi:hypothetical protein